MTISLMFQVRQSPTNVFLASLATADLLLILICLPLKVGTAGWVSVFSVSYFPDGEVVLLQLAVRVAHLQSNSLLRDAVGGLLRPQPDSPQCGEVRTGSR